MPGHSLSGWIRLPTGFNVLDALAPAAKFAACVQLWLPALKGSVPLPAAVSTPVTGVHGALANCALPLCSSAAHKHKCQEALTAAAPAVPVSTSTTWHNVLQISSGSQHFIAGIAGDSAAARREMTIARVLAMCCIKAVTWVATAYQHNRYMQLSISNRRSGMQYHQHLLHYNKGWPNVRTEDMPDLGHERGWLHCL